MVTRGEAGGGRTGALRSVDADTEGVAVAETVSRDLGPAVSACDFPLVVWATPEGRLRLANRPAADLIGLRLDDLIDRSLSDIGLPKSAVERVVSGIASDEVDSLRSRTELALTDGRVIPLWTWTRAAELDGRRAGITLLTPISDIARLGRDSVAPWRDLIPISVGLMDRAFRIASVSVEIREITGATPAEMRGRLLLDIVHPDDRARVGGPDEEPPRVATSWCHLRLRSRAGWTEGCLLVAPSQQFPERIGFALIGAPRPNAPLIDRVAELERRLRHIAAEVRAAGALETMGEMPSPSAVPELGQLSSRQWEIVSRLLNGQRVNAIADALFVSPSTVRNHLSTIFRKFGVHSQSDLLERLRRDGRPGGR